MNYNCRAGYWIVAKVGASYVEGSSGDYVLSLGTQAGTTSQGWENSGSTYSQEPWLSTTKWSFPDDDGLALDQGCVEITADRRSWSYPGTSNEYYRIGEYDFNDFVIEEITITNNCGTDIDYLTLAAKADHDCGWNTESFTINFWADDIVDYDAVTMTTMELDGDNQSTGGNDFGVDDPDRAYRGVRVGQTYIETPAPVDPHTGETQTWASDSANFISHYWWTGDEDPQTPKSRYDIATAVFSSGGDRRGVNPPPMDMRYSQGYGPWPVAAGESVTIVDAVLAGAGLVNAQQAAKNAKQAYAWDYNLPKPPPAPSMDAANFVVKEDKTIDIFWTYTAAQKGAVDPDKGVADFAGFRVYRSAPAPQASMADHLDSDMIDSDLGGSVDFPGAPFGPREMGPWKLLKDGTADDFSDGGDVYTYNDADVTYGMTYWYYVAAYDEAGSDLVHGDVPSLESYSTMNYGGNSGWGTESTTPPSFQFWGPFEEASTKSAETVFVAPNPWKTEVSETFFGAAGALGYFVRFINTDNQEINVYDASGNLVWHSTEATGTSYSWNLISDSGVQVATGVYFWSVGDQTGKLAIIR
ncbi:MAG: T9SS type A sorting domain-containing protein [Candidatus Marinimicrobia bacterium]|nr:T9SS type A sorting domain-containing protein [Candidatus Neomarinimicrobiota bacterium]MDP6594270.1 T9SS type A sorting domain-containing protein [Candidatus Neomarinimicrobiota bacterium]MDP6836691.1 T9SS type A sorting domain-containing protein [Candidatus Neomarinimicrobiota bacterium]